MYISPLFQVYLIRNYNIMKIIITKIPFSNNDFKNIIPSFALASPVFPVALIAVMARESVYAFTVFKTLRP